MFIAALANGFFGEQNSVTLNKDLHPRDQLDDNESSYENFSWLTFHGVMCIGGMAFLIMSISDWAALDD